MQLNFQSEQSVNLQMKEILQQPIMHVYFNEHHVE